MKYALLFGFAGMALPGCVSINSPLFPAQCPPMVIDRACPQSQAMRERDNTPPPTPIEMETPPISVPRLDPPAIGGGRARRAYAGL